MTVAAVDQGILNLTHYEAPDPRGYFFGQRQLSTEIRDLYGLLIDGMQGTRGAIRSGGDADAASCPASGRRKSRSRAFPASSKPARTERRGSISICLPSTAR